MHPRPPVHRTIILVDVEGFGDPQRTTAHHTSLRADLYDAIEQAFNDARIPWNKCYHEDRGDGIMILAPAGIPKSLFVESLPLSLVKEVRRHNATRPLKGQIRLRLALHAGELAFDTHGAAGPALNFAFRILEARPLKQALATSPGVLAMISSGWFYDEVVRQSPVSEPGSYRQVPVVVKETATAAWICLPDHPYGTTDSPKVAPNATAVLPSPDDPVLSTKAETRTNRLTIVLDATAHVVLVIPLDSANTSSTGAGLPTNYDEREMLRKDLVDIDLARLSAARTRASLVGAFRDRLGVLGRLRTPHPVDDQDTATGPNRRSSVNQMTPTGDDRAGSTPGRLEDESERSDKSAPRKSPPDDRRTMRHGHLLLGIMVLLTAVVIVWWLCQPNVGIVIPTAVSGHRLVEFSPQSA
jgi:hypothetical protein